jgi:hypothetical protein
MSHVLPQVPPYGEPASPEKRKEKEKEEGETESNRETDASKMEPSRVSYVQKNVIASRLVENLSFIRLGLKRLMESGEAPASMTLECGGVGPGRGP